MQKVPAQTAGVQSAKPLNSMNGHKGAVYIVKFNKDGNYCLSGSQDRTIKLWNPQKGAVIKTYQGAHNYEVLDLCLVSDDTRFASAGGDKQIFVWDVKSGQIVRKFAGHLQRINSIAWNEDYSVLVSGSYDNSLRFWDCKSNNCTKPLQIEQSFKDSVSQVIVNKAEVIASSIDGCVRTFDIRRGELTTDNFASPVVGIDLSHDEKTYIASCTNNKLNLVERVGGMILKEYAGHQIGNFLLRCTLDWEDAKIMTGSEDGSLTIYDVLSGSCIGKLKNHCRPVSSISLHPDQTQFVTSSYDNTITCWQLPGSV